MYIYILRDVLPVEVYQRRMRLVSMVNNNEPLPVQLLQQDLIALDIRTIVTQQNGTVSEDALRSSLNEAGFAVARRTSGYILWTRREHSQ
jgi:hypothetical protein